MKLKKLAIFIFTIIFASLGASSSASAASSPGLGAANSFVILSGTYSNSASGTTLNGDLGYTVPPATSPTVNGTTHSADSVYNQAGIDQGSALVNLNNQPCSFSFAPGPIDLASDTTHGPIGVYTPGVYCITGAGSIGGGGTVTLNGAGTYIFRMDGALTSSANSVVVASNGASACDTWWTPTAATILGANSTFLGTDIDASGITIGNNVNWTGRALAFGGTVSTTSDTISAPACSTPGGNTPNTPPAASVVNPGFPNTASSTSGSHPVVLNEFIIAFCTAYLIRKKVLKVALRDKR
jgi:hypothetical protein